MSENSEKPQNSENEAEQQRSTEPAPAAEGDSGQYVDGDYGKAGLAHEAEAASGDGEYPEGDYGTAGEVEEPAGAVEGEYEAGDYGKAGTAGENLVTLEEAEYPDGDYGKAGTAGPPPVPPARRILPRRPATFPDSPDRRPADPGRRFHAQRNLSHAAAISGGNPRIFDPSSAPCTPTSRWRSNELSLVDSTLD